MTPRDVINSIAGSTAQAGMNPTTAMLHGNEVLVARTSEFRLRWFATTLHTFLIASIFPPGSAAPERLDAFLVAASQYARSNKGGLPLGMQTGVAVLVVAVTEHAQQGAHQWASAPHGRQFATLPFPVMVDAANQQVTRPERMLLGGVYSKYLKSLVDHHVTAVVQQRRTP